MSIKYKTLIDGFGNAVVVKHFYGTVIDVVAGKSEYITIPQAEKIAKDLNEGIKK